MTSSPPRPLIVRLLGGIAGVVICLVALVGSLGAALGAPFGMYLVARWARRRARPPNRIASLFGAVAASSVLAMLIWGIVFLLMPRPTQDQLNSAVTEAQRQPTKLPEWYTRLFPQAARTDSVSERLMRSPGFVKATLIMGAVIMGLFLGIIGGSLTWCASLLLSLARSGPAPTPAPVESS